MIYSNNKYTADNFSTGSFIKENTTKLKLNHEGNLHDASLLTHFPLYTKSYQKAIFSFICRFYLFPFIKVHFQGKHLDALLKQISRALTICL